LTFADTLFLVEPAVEAIDLSATVDVFAPEDGDLEFKSTLVQA
jgi:hypothetical protein